MAVIKKIFDDEKSQNHVKNLFEDEKSKRLILKEAASEFSDYAKVIWKYPYEQIMAITFQAKFAEDDESVCIAKMINLHMRNSKDIFPLVTEHQGFALASRCLISLGFFRGYMEQLTNRRGMPSPEYYERVGRANFMSGGYYKIGDNFYNWEEFLQNEFAVSLKL